MAIDPQPRLDFHAGTVLSIVKEWDLFADFAVIDRGDVANPATRLPILDGGFDQKQIVFGVIRHIDGPKLPTYSTGDDAMASARGRGKKLPGVGSYPPCTITSTTWNVAAGAR